MKIRKAILTGGGRATRLQPITTTINKHLLPLANKPMIFHAIEKVVEAGVEEIFINTNPGDTVLAEAIGDGGRWGVSITFFEQTGGPQGIAHVVKEAQKFIGDDPFIFYLSDNVVLGSVKDLVDTFNEREYQCLLVLAEVPDPERFGVPVFNEQKQLVDVWEKPLNPPNSFAVTGIYLYGPKVFFEAYNHIEKSPRGEYEISSIHSYFLKHGVPVGYKEVTGWWKDTGKPIDLILANRLLLDAMPTDHFVRQGDISSDTAIHGQVRIGIGSHVKAGVTIHGPVIIGENCVLEGCVIGPNVSIGSGSTLCGATIQDTIILDNTTIQSSLRVSESLIGKNVRIVHTAPATVGGTHRLILGDKTVWEIQ